MTVALDKARRGDWTQVESPLRSDGTGIGGSSAGVYVLLEVKADIDAASAVPIGSVRGGQVQLRARDILSLMRPLGVDLDALPKSVIELRPAPKVEAPSEPEPLPVRMVKVLIINHPGPIEVTRLGHRGQKPTTTRYEPGAATVVDKAGQVHHPFLVDSRDVDQILSVQPAYLEGGPITGFSETG
jgi:hypothetical protein